MPYQIKWHPYTSMVKIVIVVTEKHAVKLMSRYCEKTNQLGSSWKIKIFDCRKKAFE